MPLYFREKDPSSWPKPVVRLPNFNFRRENFVEYLHTSSNSLLNRKITSRLLCRLNSRFLFQFVICFLTFSHQRTRVAKNQYVCRLYNVRKNGITRLDHGDTTTNKVIKLHFYNLFPTIESSPKVKERGPAPSKTITPLHVKSRNTALALIWGYAGRSPIDRVTKQHGLVKNSHSKISDWCPDSRAMTIRELNGCRFSAWFPTMGDESIDYRKDATQRKRVAAVHANSCRNAD